MKLEEGTYTSHLREGVGGGDFPAPSCLGPHPGSHGSDPKRCPAPNGATHSHKLQGRLTVAVPHEVLKSQQEEDRYKLMLNRSDSENIASNYFRSKRASQILSTDPMKSLSECPARWAFPSSTPAGKYAVGMILDSCMKVFPHISLGVLSYEVRGMASTSQDFRGRAEK